MRLTTTLRRALTLNFVVAATLPILFLGVYSVQYFKARHLETVSGLLDSHALNVSREALEFLSDTAGTLTQVEQTLGSGFLRDGEEISRYLQMVVNQSGSFETIYLLDEQHRVTHLGMSERYLGNRGDFLGMDLSAHELFHRNEQLRGPTWSNTFLSSVSVEPAVTLGLPFGKGALLGTVSLQRISAALGERLEHASGSYQFSLLDHHGVLIADSRPGYTQQRINLRHHPEVRNALDQQIEVPGKYHEDRSLLESVRLVPGIGWVAYASLPVQEAMQGVSRLRYLTITALSLAAGLGAILAVWLSNRMLKPILQVRDASRAVASGQYKQILRPALYQELEELSSSFREMIAAVEERENAISLNRARFRDLVNTIDGIVWELDLAEFRFTFVSNKAEKLLGYPSQRWVDEKDFWIRHVHADDRDWVVSFCQSETESQHDHEFEYRMIAADGRVVWLRDVVTVICEDNKPSQLRGVMIDITERKRAELELRKITTQLQLLINRMPFGCIMWNTEMKVELWNPAAEQIFGFAADEVCGLHPSEFLTPGLGRSDLTEALGLLAESDRLAHSIIENLTRDGRTITCEWHNTPLHNPDGSIQGVISIVADISQRVAAEEALAESEVRFRTAFQSNPDAVMITRLNDHRLVNVNENCLKLLGFSREEMIGRTALELNLWAKPEEREAYLALLQEHDAVDNFEMSLRIKNGRVRTGLGSSRPLTLDDEACSLIVIRDITEMKEAESRLVRSESRFRSLVAAMGEGVVILGYNGEVVQCNQTAARLLQTQSEELVGRLNDELFSGAIREDGSAYTPEQYPSAITLRTAEPVESEIMGLPRAEGTIVWLQVNTQSLGVDRDGRPVAVAVSFADVTRLKGVEDELRCNERNLLLLSQQFKGVLEAIPDQILVLDRDMSIVWMNRQMDRGLAGQVELAGIPCYEMAEVLCGPASGNKAYLCKSCPVAKTFEKRHTEEMQMDLADGRVVALRAIPVFDEQQEVVNVIEIVQDVTISRRQQTQTMRTGQLAALGELAAGVAHEINNPINGVINYAQLILNKALAGSREQELSRRIIKESERIATIVRELLYFAREESHETSRVGIADALEESLALTRNQLNREGVILQTQLDEDLPEVLSRSHQVQQLFLNLISNARHALTEKYQGSDKDKLLLIKGEKTLHNGKPAVAILFRDHGVGIAPDLLPRVMNPFVTTKASGEGTGLGLSISHEIIQKHGGTLTIDSVHGEFTEVVVVIPAATD